MSVTASIVIYNNHIKEIEQLVSMILSNSCVSKVSIIDNSPVKRNSEYLTNERKVDYVFNDKNIGYGAAHNIAMKRSINKKYDYHVVINPDIELSLGAIDRIYEYAKTTTNCGLIMPKVLYKDGTVQYLCKLLPHPFDLFVRRFIPKFFYPVFAKRIEKYELRNKDYNKQMVVPNLSGCFMFLNNRILQKVGGFDERYFMYLEDTDLCRRVGEVSQTMYYPDVYVYHGYAKESYKRFKLLQYHIQSAIKYFNKWGWFFDSYRNFKNKEVI